MQKIYTTLGTEKSILNIFAPESIAELSEQWRSKNFDRDNVFVISRGRNWGYGCHAPEVDNKLLIDLSKCNEIKNFDPYHGIVTVGPGVSYGQLADFLEDNGGQWIAPVHGGGPNCSVLGNILERGFGITPHSDHFGALKSLKALLQNGELYEGAFSKMGLDHLDRLFKYGIGPYQDGLFTQSGFGIVTEVTIQLARRPEFIEMFYLNFSSEEELLIAVDKIKKLKRSLGSILGGINIINRERVLSMIIDYPLKKIQKREPLSEEELQFYAKRHMVSPWMVIGALYGPKKMTKQAKFILKKELRTHYEKSLFFNSSNRNIYRVIKKAFFVFGKTELADKLDKLDMAFQILEGRPNNVALSLAYWKNTNKELVKHDTLNPNIDNCGLIWYAPLVEFKADSIQRYIKFINETSKKYHINPLITLTTIDDLCLDSTIPILFNRDDIEDHERAHAYFEELLDIGRKLGFFPYRLSTELQKEVDIYQLELKVPSINPLRYGRQLTKMN